MSRPIVIVGAGAAGVFTAHRLREAFGDSREIVLLERSGQIGGNASSTRIAGNTIECGAQFFHRGAQSTFMALLDSLDLWDACEVVRTAAGFTIWDRHAQRRLLHLPATIAGFRSLGVGDWGRAAKFGVFLAYAWALERWESDWTLTVDAWFARMRLLDDGFLHRVMKPFLYQFLSLPPDRIGEASAKYAVTYLVRTLFPGGGVAPPVPRLGRARPTFEAYQSLVGIDRIHRHVLAAADVRAETGTSVVEIRTGESGVVEVVTTRGTLLAEHVVLTADPHASAGMLAAGGTTDSALVDGLRALEYGRLPISVQHGNPSYMPDRRRDWQPFNTIVDGDAMMFSIWFGPMRPMNADGSPIEVFKSWGSPRLQPSTAADEVVGLEHYIPLPTARFIGNRDRLLARWQGARNVWLAGGWTQWFDSQEAALCSADAVTAGIVGTVARTGERSEGAPDARAPMHDLLVRASASAPAGAADRLAHAFDEVEARG
jgi:glycine/D-amino acid oxidase-like deaminating enzyme